MTNDFVYATLQYPLNVFVTANDSDNCIINLKNYLCNTSKEFLQLLTYLEEDAPSEEDMYEIHTIKNDRIYSLIYEYPYTDINLFKWIEYLPSNIPSKLS